MKKSTRHHQLESVTPEELSALRVKVESIIGRQPGKGWKRLWELLEAAKDDPIIQGSPPAREFLDLVYDLAGDALYCRTGDEAFAPLDRIFEALRNQRRAQVARPSDEKKKAGLLFRRMKTETGKAPTCKELLRQLEGEYRLAVSQKALQTWLTQFRKGIFPE